MKTISPVYIRVFGTQRFSAQGKPSAFLGLVCHLHTTARTSSPPSHWRRPHLDQPCAKTGAACDVATKPKNASTNCCIRHGLLCVVQKPQQYQQQRPGLPAQQSKMQASLFETLYRWESLTRAAPVCDCPRFCATAGA